MKTLVRLGLALFLITVTDRTATASSIVLNGGFENGFTNWITTPGTISLFGTGGSPHSGSSAAFFGGVNLGGGNEDTISQILATATGQWYEVSFWLRMDINSGAGCTFPQQLNCLNQDFNAFWGGTQIFATASTPLFPYTRYSFLIAATGSTTSLTFKGANEPGFYYLDDVSVEAVPEPSTWLLVGTGVAALAARLRSRRRT
jgi:hypothetical protein